MIFFRWIVIASLCISSSLLAVDLDSIVETVTTPPKQTATATKKKTTSARISSIQLRGVQHVPKKTILDELIIQKGDRLDPYKLKRSVENVRALGLFQSANSRVITLANGSKRVIITVKENKVVKDIQITGNTLFTSEEIQEVMLSKKSEIFNAKLVTKDLKEIENLYKDKGYFLVKLSELKTPKSNNGIYSLHISEGYLEEIIITGNTRTKEYVILREMDLKVGDPLNEKKVEYDVRKIYNLNYFSKLDPLFKEGDSPDSYKLTLDIEEKRTGTLNLGGGYGQRSGLFFYTDVYVDNVFGTGQLVGLKGQFGKQITSYQFKYYNPWMWDDRKSLLFKLWDTEGGFGYNPDDQSFTEEERKGAYIEFGIPLTYELRLSHGFKAERVKQPDLNNRIYDLTSYTFGVSYDTRDFRFNPREGYFHQYTTERGFIGTDKALNFTKHDVTLSKFTPTFKKQTIATRLLLGKMYGDTEPSEIYFVGGPNTVRGYEEFPDSFGTGRSRAILNIEYRFLFNDTFQALLFVDAGWASSLGEWENGKIGKGIGVRIQSPLGPIRLDLGIDEKGESRIHFNIGHVF